MSTQSNETSRQKTDDKQTEIQVEKIVKDLENIKIDATNIFSVIAAQTTIISLSAYATSMAHLLPASVKNQLMDKISQATKAAHMAVEQAQQTLIEEQKRQEAIKEAQQQEMLYQAPYGIEIDLNNSTARPTFDYNNDSLTQSVSNIANAWNSNVSYQAQQTILNNAVFNNNPQQSTAYMANTFRVNATHAALTDEQGQHVVNHVVIDALRDIESNAQIMQQCDTVIENCTNLLNDAERMETLGVTADDVNNMITESKNTKVITNTATNKEVAQTELKTLADLPELEERPNVDFASVGLAILKKIREAKQQKATDLLQDTDTPSPINQEIAAIHTPEDLEYTPRVAPEIKEKVKEAIAAKAKDDNITMPYGEIVPPIDRETVVKILSEHSNPFNILKEAIQNNGAEAVFEHNEKFADVVKNPKGNAYLEAILERHGLEDWKERAAAEQDTDGPALGA